MAVQRTGALDDDPRVLFVDGDANAAAAGALALERDAEEVTTVIERSGPDALDVLEAGDVDCLVASDDVPETPVVDFLGRAREAFGGPIVFAPRDGDETLASEALAAGVDEYVPAETTGPLQAEREGRLVDRVGAALGTYRDRPGPGFPELLEALPGGIGLLRDGRVTYANERFGSILGVDSDGDLRGTDLLAVAPDSDRLEDLIAAAREGDGAPERTTIGDDDMTPEVELYARPVGDAVVLDVHDISDRRGRERRLATLHRSTREMLRSKRAEEIAELAVETTIETLDPVAASVYVYDRDDGQLRRMAGASGVVSAPGTSSPASLASPDQHDEYAWDVFVAGELRVDEDDGVRLAIPLGDYGVLVVAEATPEALDDPDVEFARTLATNVEVALDRAHRETTILERTDRLRERTETLDRLRRIDTVVRDIGQLLVRATAREEIERAVCERLAAVEGWSYAWIGERTVTDEGVVPRNRSEETGYVEAVRATAPGAFLEAPAGSALETGETTTVEDVVAHPGAPDWRDVTLERGYRSVVSIPLVHEGREYGVLEVYGDSTGAFGEEERSVLVELGEMIAYAINAVERERALLAEGGPEIELALGEEEELFSKIATAVDAPVTVRGVVPQSDGGYLSYLTVEAADRDLDDAHEALASLADRSSTVEAVRRLGDGARFELRLSSAPLFERVVAHGATVRELTVGDGCVVRIELPGTVDVRGFVEALEGAYPDLEVLAQRSPVEDEGELEGRLVDRMTDRQREVLEVAFHSGFFEWPRESTGEEIAESLDIAPPTLHKHIRTAERKLLTGLLDSPGE